MKNVKVKPKLKKYSVPVETNVNADMIVFANSKKEAFEIADHDMKESLERLLRESKPNPMLKNVRAHAQATAYMIQIIS